MLIITAFVLHTFLWLFPAIIVLPMSRRLTRVLSAPAACAWASAGLAPALGIVFFSVVFSLVARVIHGYPLAYLMTFLILLGVVRLFRKIVLHDHESIKIFHWIFPNFVLIILHIAFWIPRFWYSDVHFDPNHYGAEKLFNLSLQQSFTYGSGYPPQSLWLAGEPEAYYILPRIIPGIATHILVNYLQIPAQIAGVFFHISDTFYNALAIMILSTLSYTLFLQRGLNRTVHFVLSALTGLFPFLAAPARTFGQWMFTGFDFWQLSRIIPFTINEYPFWNYAFADNHAHNNASFIDVLIWYLTLFLLWKGAELARSEKILLGFVTGVCATALWMSQSGSAFIAVVVFMIPLWMMGVYHFTKKSLGLYLEALLWPAGVAVALSLPDVLTRAQPKVFWNWVPPRLASTASDFANVCLSFFLLGGCAVACLSTSRESFARVSKWMQSPTFLIFVLGSWGAGYPALTIAAVFSCVLLIPMSQTDERLALFGKCVALAIFTILAFSEIIGINFNMGPDYIRLNTTFKFLYTSFFVIPLTLTFLYSLKANSSVSPLRQKVMYFVVAVFIIGFASAQGKTLLNRIQTQVTVGGPSGLEFLQEQSAGDSAILAHLNKLHGNIVIAEECGMPPKSSAYTVAGRISAYSGRPALCGWGMHSFLHHEFFTNARLRGQSVWSTLQEIDRNITLVLSSQKDMPAEKLRSVREAAKRLQEAGATHLIFGEYERELHAQTNAATIAAILNGQLIFSYDELGIIAFKD